MEPRRKDSQGKPTDEKVTQSRYLVSGADIAAPDRATIKQAVPLKNAESRQSAKKLDTPQFVGNRSFKFPQSSIAVSSSQMSHQANDDNTSHDSRVDISGSMDQFRSITIQQDEDSQQGQAKETIQNIIYKNFNGSHLLYQSSHNQSNDYAHLGRLKPSKHFKGGSD